MVTVRGVTKSRTRLSDLTAAESGHSGSSGWEMSQQTNSARGNNLNLKPLGSLMERGKTYYSIASSLFSLFLSLLTCPHQVSIVSCCGAWAH